MAVKTQLNIGYNVDREVHGRLDCTCGITSFLSVHCHWRDSLKQGNRGNVVMSCWTRTISSYIGHKFKSNRHTHIAEVRQHCAATARLTASRQTDAGWADQSPPPAVAQRPHRHGCRAATDWPLAPCCLVPVGREDNALSSVRLKVLWT